MRQYLDPNNLATVWLSNSFQVHVSMGHNSVPLKQKNKLIPFETFNYMSSFIFIMEYNRYLKEKEISSTF